jgi:hypothetical protein
MPFIWGLGTMLPAMPCISLLKKLGAIDGSMVLGMKFMGFGEPRD